MTQQSDYRCDGEDEDAVQEGVTRQTREERKKGRKERHERMTVAMVLAEMSHHTAPMENRGWQEPGDRLAWSRARRRCPTPGRRTRRSAPKMRKCRIFAKFCKFLAGSFSAVSKRNFARKYVFDSIFQALQDLHTFAPRRTQHFIKKIGLKNQQFS